MRLRRGYPDQNQLNGETNSPERAEGNGMKAVPQKQDAHDMEPGSLAAKLGKRKNWRLCLFHRL